MNKSAQPPAAPFLWGSFERFPLDSVFGVLALCRQLVGIRLSDAEREVGAITVKAGHVLGAEDFRTPASGTAALKTLICDPGTEFSVTRLPVDQAEIRDPVVLGTLSELFPKTGNGRGRGTVASAPARVHPETDFATDRQRKASGVQVPAGRSGGEPAAGGDGDAAKSSASGRDAQKTVDDSTPSALASGQESRAPGAVTAPALGTAPARVSAGDARKLAPPAKTTGEVILRGTSDAGRLEELLEVLQLNPDPLRILFMRDGNVVGTLDLMAQQVVKTAAGPLHGREAFAKLYADPGETFEVRSAAQMGQTDALGSLSELLAEARGARTAPSVKQAVPTSERSLFMEGRLADFSFELLIAALHRFRHPIELELRSAGELLHRVQLSAGRIVSAESVGVGDGDRALAAIRGNPGTAFVVYRRRERQNGTAIAPLKVPLSEAGAVPAPGQRVARAVDRPAAAPAEAVRGETETEDGHFSGIEGRLDSLAGSIAELRQALEVEKQVPDETLQVPRASSEFMSAMANFVTVLEKAHKDALQQVCDTLEARYRGVLRAVIVLQCACLAFIFLAALAALVAP